MMRIRRPQGVKDRPACERKLAVEGESYLRRKGLPDELAATSCVRAGLDKALD
jgi:hypothetical protein